MREKGHLFIAKLPRELPDIDGGHPPRFEQVDSCQNQRQNASNDQPNRHDRSLALLLLPRRIVKRSQSQCGLGAASVRRCAVRTIMHALHARSAQSQMSGRVRSKDGGVVKGKAIAHFTRNHLTSQAMNVLQRTVELS